MRNKRDIYFWVHRYRWELVSLRSAVQLDSGRRGVCGVCRWRELVVLMCCRLASPEAEWKTPHWTTWTILSGENKGCRSVYHPLLMTITVHFSKYWAPDKQSSTFQTKMLTCLVITYHEMMAGNYIYPIPYQEMVFSLYNIHKNNEQFLITVTLQTLQCDYISNVHFSC